VEKNLFLTYLCLSQHIKTDQRSFFRKGNQIYFTLIPEYTDDGGHLNTLGRKIVAEQLLIFLADPANDS